MKDTAKVLEDKAAKKIKKADTKKVISLITQGNALNRSAKESEVTATNLENTTLKVLLNEKRAKLDYYIIFVLMITTSIGVC